MVNIVGMVTGTWGFHMHVARYMYLIGFSLFLHEGAGNMKRSLDYLESHSEMGPRT